MSQLDGGAESESESDMTGDSEREYFKLKLERKTLFLHFFGP